MIIAFMAVDNTYSNAVFDKEPRAYHSKQMQPVTKIWVHIWLDWQGSMLARRGGRQEDPT
jgi:hypothetical protein